jgi:hypothetical protein
LSVIDRLRDRVDHAIQRDPARDSRRLKTASRMLTGAHQVEGLPLMKHGEDPATHR